jgi:hypothetical protein
MPSAGLDEAVASLRDILEFRLQPETPVLPPVEYVSTGTVASTEVRPNLVFAEDLAVTQ